MSLSREKLGPDALHTLARVEPHGHQAVAVCTCGWRSGRRRRVAIARESLIAHIAKAS